MNVPGNNGDRGSHGDDVSTSRRVRRVIEAVIAVVVFVRPGMEGVFGFEISFGRKRQRRLEAPSLDGIGNGPAQHLRAGDSYDRSSGAVRVDGEGDSDVSTDVGGAGNGRIGDVGRDSEDGRRGELGERGRRNNWKKCDREEL